jgi:hypothetical protein
MVQEAVAASGFTITKVISGGAAGVDQLGERWAEEHGVPCEIYGADWDAYGKAAGPLRNRKMAAHADALIAIMLSGGSPGTKNMIETASKAKLKVYVHLI